MFQIFSRISLLLQQIMNSFESLLATRSIYTIKQLLLPQEATIQKQKEYSAMYTDSIFPEDFADIDSLKGSLEGE